MTAGLQTPHAWVSASNGSSWHFSARTASTWRNGRRRCAPGCGREESDSVTILFADFELLSKSDLFDPAYYLEANPDIAALNVNPLMHYLEWGCRERRDPSPHFDTLHYLRQCGEFGETPVNALAHYVTV